MSHEVFISHSAKDGATAEAVCEALESEGIECWLASRDIVGGNYAEAIMKAIKASRLMVLVLTPAANASPHVLREVDRAVYNGITIYPFKVKETELSDALEYLISPAQSLDATQPPLEKHLARLSRNVARLLQNAGPPPAQPPPSVKEEPAPAPAPPADFVYDAFISASIFDNEWARALHAGLESKGFKCFPDLTPPGPPIRISDVSGILSDPSRLKYLTKSRHLIVLWSKPAKRAELVRRTLAQFEAMLNPQKTGQPKGGRKIIFIVLDGEPVSSGHSKIINDVKEKGGYAHGFKQLDPRVWGRVIDKVTEALRR